MQFYVSGLEGSIFPLHPAQAGLVNNLSVLGGVHQRMATIPRTFCRDLTMREARGPLSPQCEPLHPPCSGSRATLCRDSTNHQFAWISHPSHASGQRLPTCKQDECDTRHYSHSFAFHADKPTASLESRRISMPTASGSSHGGASIHRWTSAHPECPDMASRNCWRRAAVVGRPLSYPSGCYAVAGLVANYLHHYSQRALRTPVTSQIRIRYAASR